MTNSRKIGKMGLSIPVINPSNVPKLKQTPEQVARWIAALPMADTGSTAKQLFTSLSEINQLALDPVERFKLIELYRITIRDICTTLQKHYIEQTTPLTQHKLLIANLRQTLLTEMGDNYRTIFEELAERPNRNEEEQIILSTSISRILYYINAVMLCSYQLYSAIPNDLWKESHILYKYAKTNNLLHVQLYAPLLFSGKTNILASYARILLLSATDPYQWRQKDQYSINKAIDYWAVAPMIYEYEQIPENKVGIYIVDLDKDQPPIPYSFRRESISNSCIALDLASNVKHLKELLLKIYNNEEQAKLEHPNDAEFSITVPILAKLIKVWSQLITRNAQRFSITAKIKVAFGIVAAHYLINNKIEFNPQPNNLLHSENDSTYIPLKNRKFALPTFEVDDEKNETEILSTTKSTENAANSMVNNEYLYEIYNYTIDNISPNGFCIQIDDGSIPPFQAGEIMVFKNPEDAENAPWSLGSVRWIRNATNKTFQIGIELIAPFAKAAGIQMVRQNNPVGLLLRCLILPEAPDINAATILITPTLPLKSSDIMLYLNEQIIAATLIKELDATGTYHQYTYKTKENIQITDPDLGRDEQAQNTVQEEPKPELSSKFDDIWGEL